MKKLKTYVELFENVKDPRPRLFFKKLKKWFIPIDNYKILDDDEIFSFGISDIENNTYIEVYYIHTFLNYINDFFDEFEKCLRLKNSTPASVVEEYKELYNILKEFIDKHYQDYYQDYLKQKKIRKFNL